MGQEIVQLSLRGPATNETEYLYFREVFREYIGHIALLELTHITIIVK